MWGRGELAGVALALIVGFGIVVLIGLTVLITLYNE